MLYITVSSRNLSEQNNSFNLKKAKKQQDKQGRNLIGSCL
jgi:hypothetical protein